MNAPVRPPDTVVLAGGGILGEAWMAGVAIGLRRGGGPDLTAAGHYVGTSAGSIMATMITGGRPLEDRMRRLAGTAGVTDAEVVATYTRISRDAGRPAGLFTGAVARAGLTVVGPGLNFLRRAFLRRVPDGRESLERLGLSIDGLGVTWNGRLRITAVDRQTGQRVVFGNELTESVSVSEAVLASCAIPGHFRPVDGGGQTFVDGSLWSFSNLDLADSGRGRTVICLNPAGTRAEGVPLLRGAALSSTVRVMCWLEAASLRSEGTQVTVIQPNAEAAVAIGPSRMDVERVDVTVTAGIAQGLGLAESLAERLSSASP